MIDGMRFTLEFDPLQLRYLNASSTFGLHSNLVIISNEVESGQLGIVFINFNEKMSLEALELKFEKLSGSVTNSAITASSGIYQPEGYLNDNIHPVKLR